jgi:hypothetical protein
MHKNATKCNETLSKWCKKQAWSIKNYRYVSDVSGVAAVGGRGGRGGGAPGGGVLAPDPSEEEAIRRAI